MSGEVNENPLDVSMKESDADVVAHIEAMKSALHSSFHWRPKSPHPCSFRAGSGNDGVELLSDSAAEQERRGGLSHPPFNLGRVVFFLGAMLCELGKIRKRVGKRRARHRRFHKPL